MLKSTRFLLQFVWINVAVLLGTAAAIVIGAMATGVPNGADNPFRTYLSAFPLMELIILFIYSFALCTSNLNLALSFGARRRDFFWAIQGAMLVYTLVCWGIQQVLSLIPGAFGWSNLDRWDTMLSLGGQPMWLFPLACLTILAMGCLCGLVFVRSKLWGTVILISAMLVGMAATVLLMITADMARVGLWGDLPLLLAVGMAVVAVVCEVLIRRTVFRYMAR